MTPFVPYRPRALACLGVEGTVGYRLKTYAIRHDESPFDRERFQDGWDLAIRQLPSPAITEGRPGLGFAILHQGRTGDYLILCWWDRENELPTRVFIRDDGGWRPATSSESFCVWDLRVLWWEREAYVASVLAGREGGAEAYLGMMVEGWA